MSPVSRIFISTNSKGLNFASCQLNRAFHQSHSLLVASTSNIDNDAKQPTQNRSERIEVLKRENERRERISKISEAMKDYLKSLQNFEEGEDRQRLEFEQGKRHLANIMGFDPETMTQREIDESIRYLLPSGLFDKKTRPQMKPPGIVQPPRKQDVDEYGWPKHTLFYTLRPKFFTLLSEVNRRTLRLVRTYDQQQLDYLNGKSHEPPKGEPLKFRVREWKYEGERLNEDMHASMVMALEYMAQLPNASLEAEFLQSMGADPLESEKKESEEEAEKPLDLYRGGKFGKFEDGKLSTSPDGRRQATALSLLKATRMEATVIVPGTGIIEVDGHTYDVFRDIQAREILLSPMIVTDLLGKIDVIAKKQSGPGGQSVIPRSVRHATALCLVALFPELGPRLRLAGLLNPDMRGRERIKINQPGARAKWIWKKR